MSVFTGFELIDPYPRSVRPVTVQFFKKPDILHWGFDGFYLGEDQFGRWIALPEGSQRWKGDGDIRPTMEDAVLCAPHEGWWHWHYAGAAAPNYTGFADICTPPVWVGENSYEMIDLDLDVGLRHDGEVVVEDEDEFEQHQVLHSYPPEMVERALEETEMIADALRLRQEPFFEVSERWLCEVGV